MFSEILHKVHINKQKHVALPFHLECNNSVWFLIRYWRLYWMKSHFLAEVRNFISIVLKWLMLFGLICSLVEKEKRWFTWHVMQFKSDSLGSMDCRITLISGIRKSKLKLILLHMANLFRTLNSMEKVLNEL